MFAWRQGKDRFFDLKNIKKSPVFGTFSGDIGEIAVNGLLTKKDDNIVLSISPKTHNDDDLKYLKNFANDIKKEIGIENNKAGFKIELNDNTKHE